MPSPPCRNRIADIFSPPAHAGGSEGCASPLLQTLRQPLLQLLSGSRQTRGVVEQIPNAVVLEVLVKDLRRGQRNRVGDCGVARPEAIPAAADFLE